MVQIIDVFFLFYYFIKLFGLLFLYFHPCVAGIKSAPSILQTFYMNIYSLQIRQKNKSCCVRKKRNAKPAYEFLNKIKNIVTALLSIAGM